MKLAGKTDIGMVRRENQDDFRAGTLPGGAAWGLVCDGMGGTKGGREASHLACDVIERQLLGKYPGCGMGEERLLMENAIKQANWQVFQKSVQNPDLSGMGTTVVCAIYRSGRMHLCHAGDSRAYLLRDGRLSQLTHDHSYVQELVDCGTITPDEAENHPQKNIITRALGVEVRLEPEYTTLELVRGDCILICSDGLSNAVSPSAIERQFNRLDFYDLPEKLIEMANAQGGQDNITVLLMAPEAQEVSNG